jgi:serine protease Do
MKTHTCIVMLGAAAVAASLGTSRAVAGASTAEHHVVIEKTVTDSAPEDESEPVTYMGVAVVRAGPALAAQLRLPDGQGLVVDFVEPDSPAAKAGLEKHDLLLKLDDQLLIEPRQLSVLVRTHQEGDAVKVTYLRGGEQATATVTLATHVAAAEDHVFHWIAGDAPDMYFSTEDTESFSGPLMRRLHESRIMEAPPAPGASPMPGPPARAPRVMIFRPQADIVFSDEKGALTVRMDRDRQMLTATAPDGKVIFSGPIGTEEERAALPDDLRARLEKLESLEAVAPEPPPPPAAPAVPAPTVDADDDAAPTV